MEDLIIIGSGPAGLTAAIYAARAQIVPMVIQGLEPGGQLTTTTVIENWPGHPDGIEGPALMGRMKKQAQRFGARFTAGEVTGISLEGQPFTISVGNENLHTKCLIVATGASPRLMGLEAEKKLMGRGVSVCATCDGFFFKQKKVLVVGGGDTAMEEAIFLSGLASHVTVVHRRDQLRASKTMQQRALEADNIDFLWNCVIDEIHDPEKGSVTAAVVRNVQNGDRSLHPCDGIFVALGHTPNSHLFQGVLEIDSHGYILTQPGSSSTNTGGVFAAGDVVDPVYKQAVTAAGMGCMAALDAERYIRGL